MAERWQQWMPFHIDRWRGSAHVQAMRAAARSGYLYLLAEAWQTSDCTLPLDNEELQVLSGLREDEWKEFGPRILKRFIEVDGRLVNEVVKAEWAEAKRIFESRSASAKRTTASRSSSGGRTVTVQSPSRRADTITGTGTSTETKDKNSCAADAAPPVRSLAEFRAEVDRHWSEHVRPGVQAPWDRSEDKHLRELLKAMPSLTVLQFREMLDNRARSTVQHSDRPRKWLQSVSTYANGPVDQYGKPMATKARPESTVGMRLVRDGPPGEAMPEGDDPGEDARGYWQSVAERRPEEFNRAAPVWAKLAYGQVEARA